VDYVWDPDKNVCSDLRKQENDLIARSRIMTVNSRILYQLHKKKRNDIHLVPQGFRMNEFDGSVKKIKNIKHFQKPTIGMVGVINYRIHYQLVRQLAKRNPGWNFVLWGHRDGMLYNSVYNVEKYMRALQSLPNVTFGESRTAGETYSKIRSFDICMIPYNISYDSNIYCHPMKVFEYFYIGKPVIATPIKELRRFAPYVRTGKTVSEWEKHIHYFLSLPWPSSYRKEQRRLAAENSWEKKISAVNLIISEALTGTLPHRRIRRRV
jgi:glycosyltransferase involved in cell wall biosynthesis